MNRCCLLIVFIFIAGCSEQSTEPAATSNSAASGEKTETLTPGKSLTGDGKSTAQTAADDTTDAEPAGRTFAPIQLGGAATKSATDTNSGKPTALTVDQCIEKLKPLQVLLGEWRGTTRREFKNFKAVDQHEWVWDLTTTPSSPALVMTSDKSPYLRKARLVATADGFELSTTDANEQTHQFVGTFTEPVRDVPGDSDSLQRTYKLQFSEVNPGKEEWQIVFNQQENNRYLLELARRRGKARMVRHDTVSTQREGTSFALSDSDYGEKTCIISQGLGTISVSYKGRSYWVCCSGCKAAFEEDPEKWIARAAELKSK